MQIVRMFAWLCKNFSQRLQLIIQVTGLAEGVSSKNSDPKIKDAINQHHLVIFAKRSGKWECANRFSVPILCRFVH